MVNSEGLSGGMLTIWNKVTIEPIFNFKRKGMLGINAVWKGTKCYFINVYFSCDLKDKRYLWNCLLDWKHKLSVGEWIIVGDFNAIKLGEEWIGKTQ